MAKSRDYEAYKAKQAEISRERALAGRDIAPLPKVRRPKLKADCRKSFRLFCEKYLANHFPLAWSDDHLHSIARLETTVLEGGQFAFAMPRGSGKTTLCQAAAVWSVCYAHRRFVVLIGATETHAEELLDAIRIELETNDELLADFPEVCYPIRSLEGIANRANGQLIDGERTRMSWTSKELVLPTVKKSKTSGIVLRVAGITGRIRGMRAGTAKGESIRPDLVIVDDPQTDESARSPAQNDYRERVLSGAVLGLAGPKTKIAAAMPCTVIAPGDMADRILDRDRNPQWHGERAKLVYSFPTNEKLWDEYARIRRESMRNGGNGSEATEFYRQHRHDMDSGAMVGWLERFNGDELSALQHAMNLKIDKPHAFAAEYQNEPIDEVNRSELPELKPDDVAKRLNGLERYVVPRECDRLVSMIDLGGKVHWYVVLALNDRFGGSIIDYGTWPKQNKAYFAASDARPSLENVYQNYEETARVYAGGMELVSSICGRTYPRDGGGEYTIERCLIDSGWLPDPVFRLCRESRFTSLLLPSKGYSITENGRPMSEWGQKPGERLGHNWRITPQTGGGRGRLCVFDPNAWKTFAVERLLTPMGSDSSISLYGKQSHVHQLIADHFCAEYRERKEGRRTVDVWRMKPMRTDNHLWDCLVGSVVAASVQGLEWTTAALAGQFNPPASRPKIKLSELQRQKREQREREKYGNLNSRGMR